MGYAASKSQASLRAWLSFGAPILGLVVIVALGAAAAYVSFAQQENRSFREDSSRLVSNSLSERARGLANNTLDFSSWNDAYQRISVRWDRTWVDNNYYSAVADAFLIFRQNGEVRHTWVAEARADRSTPLRQSLLGAALSLPGLSGLERAPTAAGTVTRTLAAIDGDLAIVAVGAITPEDDKERLAALRGPGADLLASLKILSARDLAELGGTLGLGSFHFAPVGRAPEEDMLSLPLRDQSGKAIGELRWRDQRPGDKVFAAQMPPVVLGLVLIGIVALLLARALVLRHVASITRGRAAEESSRLKSEFIATMTHELRTPLNAIIGYAELIQEEAEERPDYAFAADDAGRILMASRQLKQLVDDTLDQTRIDAGHLKLKWTWVNVDDLLGEIEDVLSPQAQLNNDRFEAVAASPGMHLLSDHQRVRQCLLNIAGNAIKFTKNGAVKVSARQAMRRGAPFVTFDVSDTGIGISREQARRLFEPFGQADDDTHQIYGGVGLGLVIARKLARAMGGDIELVSKPGEGSCFSLHLPVGNETQAMPSAASPSSPESRQTPLQSANRAYRHSGR